MRTQIVPIVPLLGRSLGLLCLGTCLGLSGLALTARPAAASCGSTSCPIETHALNQPEAGSWTLDLSFQYIDQDQPRIGTHKAEVGEIPSPHDEVRTVNRVASLNLQYAATDRFTLGLTVPYVSRFHEHIEEVDEELFDRAGAKRGFEGGGPESWHLEGQGDVALQARARVWGSGKTGATALWATGGLEFATGRTRLTNDEGEEAEVPIQPGSGSTDATVGLTLQGSLHRDTVLAGTLGHSTLIPWFVAATFRRNGEGIDDYRLGDEWQVNAGTAYPLASRLDALLQLNTRWRGKDDPGTTGEEPDLTGGTFVFASPGLRVGLPHQTAGYLYVQLPLYQDVNGLQLTARANWFAGVQARF